MPDRSSFGSVTINRVTSDNSTPTNEPIIDGQLLHDLDPAFERFTSFNLPGPNYHQTKPVSQSNYTRQLASWARIVETFGYRDVQRDFIEDGDFIGEPYSLENQTVTMYPFNQQTEDHNFYQEARLELAGQRTRMKHALVLGGSYERNKGSSVYDGLLTDEETFGFPDFSYVNPVIPDRSLWMHDPSSVAFKVGITGLFGQYIVEPAQRLVVTLAGRYDRLALDATQGTSPEVEETFDAFSPKVGATVRLLESEGQTTGTTLNAFGAYSQAFLPPRRPSALQAADTELNLKPGGASTGCRTVLLRVPRRRLRRVGQRDAAGHGLAALRGAAPPPGDGPGGDHAPVDGETVTMDAGWFKLKDARLWTRAQTRPKLYVSAFGPQSAEVAARFGDGLWTLGDPEKAPAIVEAYRAACDDHGREPGEIIFQAGFAWADDERAAIEGARHWKPTQLPELYLEDIADQEDMQRRADAQMSDEEFAREGFLVSSDPEEHVERIREMERAGATVICLQLIGRADPFGSIRTYGEQVLPALRRAVGA